MTLENVIRRTAALIICAAVCVGTAGCGKSDKKADETKESGPSAMANSVGSTAYTPRGSTGTILQARWTPMLGSRLLLSSRLTA